MRELEERGVSSPQIPFYPPKPPFITPDPLLPPPNPLSSPQIPFNSPQTPFPRPKSPFTPQQCPAVTARPRWAPCPSRAPLYSVHVLRVGYNRPNPDGSCLADGSVTLLLGGPLTVLVDTGGPWLRPLLPGLLAAHGTAPRDVTHVVVTHGHSDHAGNLNAFPEATLLVGFDLSRGRGLYLPHGLARGAPLQLTPGTCAWSPTPGHTRAHVSLVVEGTSAGTVAVAGDAFEHGEDEGEWEALSEEPDVQRKSREELAAVADVIVPGHGEPFRVVRGVGAERAAGGGGGGGGGGQVEV
ncbi:LOW QUALITY PROTEIN: metallo-beta-lactamase domain-containing protein 1 [Agelaius tricolor]|uniref:LOW QUALITY PROTEIN: metallo-beta-lactamase domain-containing protein 1 n=1 Tax=Agelaius tricolor TaxID=9191 RepID=UPI0039F20051